MFKLKKSHILIFLYLFLSESVYCAQLHQIPKIANQSTKIQLDSETIQIKLQPNAVLQYINSTQSLFYNSEVHLNLSPICDEIFTIESFVNYGNSQVVATGHLKGQRLNRVYLSIYKDAITARILNTKGKSIAIQYDHDGYHKVNLIEQPDESSCKVEFDESNMTHNLQHSSISVKPQQTESETEILDVMIVYTPLAREYMKSDFAMRSLIQLAVAEANDVFINSQIDARLRLVYAGEIDDEFNSVSELRDKNDGVADEVHDIRDRVGADLVCLFNTRSGGTAYLMSDPRQSFERSAFSIVGIANAAAPIYTFSHEIAHNLGCSHEREESYTPGAYPYGAGYRFQAMYSQFATVMKAVKRGQMTLVPYYSDPDITYQGVSIGRVDGSVDSFGNENSANNAQVIRNTISIASEFRPAAEMDIQIVTPIADQVFSNEESVVVSASLGSDVSNINSLDLIINGINFAVLEAPLFEYTIPILPPGAYTLMLRATLDDDTTIESALTAITINDGWSSLFGRDGHELPVNDIAVRKGIVYAAGEFIEVGSVDANHVARWDSFSWSVFGQPYQDFLRTFRNSHALSVCGNDVYLGWDHGEVTRINEISGEEFGLKLNGSGSVLVLKAVDSKLYVGGNFKRSSSPSFNYLGVWDEERRQWFNLGPLLDGPVHDLAIDEDFLYVAGEFTHAGETQINHIAAWDLQQHCWVPLGEGVNDTVASIAVNDNKVYIGGEFSSAGETPISHIAVWDWEMQQWSSVGSGVNDQVLTLAAKDGSVFAGGEFTTAGGKAANFIARWDELNKEWNPLGKGVNGVVRSLAVFGDSVYVGGDFNQAGRWPAMNFSEWRSAALSDSERSTHFVSQFPSAIDFDDNRSINEDDLLNWRKLMQSFDEEEKAIGDLNQDGAVNSKDLFTLYSYWQMNRECDCD